MKNFSCLFLVLVVSSLHLGAQNLSKGTMSYKVSLKKTTVAYTKTQSSQADSAYSTHYAVYLPGGDTLYKILLVNNLNSKILRSMAYSAGQQAKSNISSVSYKLYNSGMVMNQFSLADTGIDAAKVYDWMVCFGDTSRTYVNLCNITLNDTVNIALDKLPKNILAEHNRICKGFINAPVLVKMMQKQDRQLGNRIKQLESSSAACSKFSASMGAENAKLTSELKDISEKIQTMSTNYDSLCNRVYKLSYAPTAVATSNKDAWDIKVDSLLYKHAHENYFDNIDVKFIIKIQTDTNGVVTATDLVFPASISALGSKENYIFTVLSGIIKKETFTPNKIDVYGKKYAVKTFIEKDLFISIKNRKEKILFTDKDNVVYNETKLPLPQDVKDQFNSKLYTGAKSGKYGAQIMSFMVNKLTKEVVKSVDL